MLTKKQCHSERSEESRVHKVGVTEILRYALDDKMIGYFYYGTPSLLLTIRFAKEQETFAN